VVATRTDEPIVLDGVLAEGAWRLAPVISDFTQSKPDRGLPVTQRTEVRILYDDTYLYVGAEMWDTEPDRIIIPSLEQDFESGNSDIFGIAPGSTRKDGRWSGPSPSRRCVSIPAGALRTGACSSCVASAGTTRRPTGRRWINGIASTRCPRPGPCVDWRGSARDGTSS
jgi:hypothetical protein